MVDSGCLIKYLIDEEIKSDGYFASDADRSAFAAFLNELNGKLGTDYHYLTEIDYYRIPGSGEIVSKFIPQIRSETARSYMMGQMVADRITDCGPLLFQMYLHFRASDEYIAEKGKPSPAHIYVRYDNYFRKLKPRKLKTGLLQLAHSPRDADYLPFTMMMLASWKIPEMKDVLIGYLLGDSITPEAVDLPRDEGDYAPSLQTIKRDLKFTALAGLKYYPSEEVLDLVVQCTKEPDEDIVKAAQKSIGEIEKQLS